MHPAAAIIALYLLAIMAIGSWGSHVRALNDFHLAGRNIGLVLLTGTFCATIIGASSTLGMAGISFKSGLPGAWWMLSGTVGLLVLTIFFAGKVRATGCYTLPELMGSFYGMRVRFAASVLILVSWVGVIAVQIMASGKVLAVVLGGDEAVFMIACAAVFILYTIHGGQSSVVRTDLVQLLIILLGMAALFSEALKVAGPGVILSQSFPTSSEMGSIDVLSMILVVGSAYLVGPDIYSRLLSAHSPREARISAAISAMILIPTAFMIASLGIFARSLYPDAIPEQALLVLMKGILPPAMEGLVAAALIAAFMSSADTSLMTATSILTLDIYRKASPESSEKKLIAISRLFVLIIGILALVLAVSIPDIIKTLLIAYTLFTSGLLLPAIAGFYRESLGLTPSGALFALAGGGTCALFLGGRYPLLGLAVSAVLLFAVSWLDRSNKR